MSKAQTVIAMIQIVLVIAALVLLAVNRHESFQDFMIMSLFAGSFKECSTLKNSDE